MELIDGFETNLVKECFSSSAAYDQNSIEKHQNNFIAPSMRLFQTKETIEINLNTYWVDMHEDFVIIDQTGSIDSDTHEMEFLVIFVYIKGKIYKSQISMYISN